MVKLVLMKNCHHNRHGLHPELQLSRSACEILANRGYENAVKCLNERDFTGEIRIDRSDENLIFVVETLGKYAAGYSCDLKIICIPDDVKFILDLEGSNEIVREAHRIWK